ncbi:hypothetical protein Tco_1093552 [Tanacetum coccineum]|uniref:Uncharacterized protein n=1 Tax=Tanacetum coccineum TaxID=301880 RepID=A0ABQ5ID10_9ASTR
MSYSGLEEFQQPEFEGYGPKTSKSVSENISNEVRESPTAPLVKEFVSDDKLVKNTIFPTVSKIEFVRPKQQEKPVRKPVKYAEMYRSQTPRGNQRNWNNQKSQQLGSNFVMYNKACFICGSFDHVQAHCNYHQKERVVSGNNYTRVNYNYFFKKAHPSAHRNMVPRAVLMKTGLRPLNTARPITTAHLKTIVYSARSMSCFSKSAQSTVKRPYQTRPTLTNKNFSQKVNTTKGKFYTARQKAVNTARPNSAVVNALNLSTAKFKFNAVEVDFINTSIKGIKQFWTTSKAKTVNGEMQMQALIDRKKVIVTEMSVRRALQLKDTEGTECLPNAIIFEQLTLMVAKITAWNEFSSTMASTIICLATNQKFNFSKYIFDNMVKNLEGGVKFLMYPRFVQVFLDKQVEGMTKHKEIYVTPSHTKKVFANMKRGGKGFSGRVTPLFQTIMVQAPDELESIIDEAANEKHVPTHSNDPLLSVLDLENTKTSQAAEITKLKERVKKLERRNKSRTSGLKRLRKVGRTARIESFEDEGLGAQEDASKQGRKIVDLDADAEEVGVEKVVSIAEVTTVSATTTTVDLLTLAQTLIEIKEAKPKAVTTAATTTTTVITRPKARGVVVQEPSEFTKVTSPSQLSQLPQAKDNGKAKMIEPEKPLKKKDQILIDEEIAQKLQA